MADGSPGFPSTGEGSLGGEELNQWNEVALTQTLGMEGGRGREKEGEGKEGEGRGGRGGEGRKEGRGKGEKSRREKGRGAEGEEEKLTRLDAPTTPDLLLQPLPVMAKTAAE